MIYLFDKKKKLQKILPKKNIISATQTVEINALYTVTVDVPLFFENKEGQHFNNQKNVEKARFVGHYDFNDRFQLYKIYKRKIDVKNNGQKTLIFDGVHIFFDEAQGMGNLHDRRWRDAEAREPAEMAFNSIGWTLRDYDVTNRENINYYRDSVAQARNHLIETYDVEFDYGLQFDGRKIISKDIYMMNRIGQWTGKRYAYGSNILSLSQEQDESEVYTAAVGRGRGEESGEGHGPRLEFGDIEWSKDGITKPVGQNWIEIPSATQEHGYHVDGEIKPRMAAEVVFEDIEDAQLLADSTYYWLLENCVPKATWQTEVARVGNVNLGDSVGVIYKQANIVKIARVHKMENNLLNKKQSKVTLGDYRHFKQDKRQQRIDSQINRNWQDNQSYLTQLKNEFDANFDEQTTAINNAYQQAVIDANAEIDAAETRMRDDLESQRTEMEDDYNQKVEDAEIHAENQAQEKANAVQGNLDSFKGEHQDMYDEVVGDVASIDDFIGDKSIDLSTQFADVHERYDTVVSDLSTVSGNLSDARTDLQSQLDDAQAELEGLEVGGRNLHLVDNYSHHSNAGFSQTGLWTSAVVWVEPDTEYTISFDSTESNRLGVYQGDLTDGLLSPLENMTTILNHREITIGDRIERTITTGGVGSVIAIYLSNESGDIREPNLMVSRGNMVLDYQPAPEDTEQKITDINTSITELENGLQAKLEQTDIEPLQNTITEHSTTLEATTTDISALQDKTELHDGDITKWSNETVSNAEEINTALSRVSDTEDGLEQAQLDITANADELALTASQSDLNSATGRIENVETDISVEAGRIDTLLSTTDGHDTRLTDLSASVDGISSTVAGHDDWLGTYGSAAEQTIDGFEQKVWTDDIYNPNMLSHTDVVKLEHRLEWEQWYVNVTGSAYNEFMRVRNTDSRGSIGAQSPPLEIIEGETYTLSWTGYTYGDSVDDRMQYNYLTQENGNYGIPNPKRRVVDSNPGSYGGNTIYEYETTFTARRTEENARVMIGGYTASEGIDASFAFKHPKLEMGDRATPYNTSFSALEQRADEIALQLSAINGDYVTQSEFEITAGQVSTLTSNVSDHETQIGDLTVSYDDISATVADLENDTVKQSDIEITSDYVQLASKRLGDDEFASIFRVSPNTIDVITEEMRISADMAVAGDIESISMSAIEGEFANLWAAEFQAVTITGQHIDANTITIDHLTGYDAILELLMARSIFSENVTTIGIEAIYADLRKVDSEIMTTNILKSEWLEVDTALFNRFTSDEAFIDRLEVKAANVRDLTAITIDAVEANLTTVMNAMGDVEGGLSIRRPDGILFIQQGLERFGHPVPLTDYMDDGVSFDGKLYSTAKKGAQIFKIAYGDHAGRYYNLAIGVALRWDSESTSIEMGVNIRAQNTPSGVNWPNFNQIFTVQRNAGTTWHTLNVPLGSPTYGAMSFTVEFYRNDPWEATNYVQIRTGRSWVSA